MLVERNLNLHVYSHWVSHGKYKILHIRQGAISQGLCAGAGFRTLSKPFLTRMGLGDNRIVIT